MSARFQKASFPELEAFRDAAIADGNVKLAAELASITVTRTDSQRITDSAEIRERYIGRLQTARDVFLRAAQSGQVLEEAKREKVDLERTAARVTSGLGYANTPMVGRESELLDVTNAAAHAAQSNGVGTPLFYRTAAQMYEAHLLAASRGQVLAHAGFRDAVAIPTDLWKEAGKTLAALEVPDIDVEPTPKFEMPTLVRRRSPVAQVDPSGEGWQRPQLVRRPSRTPQPTDLLPAPSFVIETGVAEIQMGNPQATTRRGRKLDVARVGTQLSVTPLEDGMVEVTARVIPHDGDKFRVEKVRLSGSNVLAVSESQDKSATAVLPAEKVKALSIAIDMSSIADQRRVGHGLSPVEVTLTPDEGHQAVAVTTHSFREGRVDHGVKPLVVANDGAALAR